MLIDDFELELSTPECDLASAVYKADIHLSADISEVLPYLNATLERAEFIPGMPVLVWTEGGHRYALRPHEIAISTILEKKEANELAYALVRRINKVWEDRANIEPSYASWEKPKVLEVMKLLPRTNCKECGVPTCMAFATKLAEGKANLDECPALSSDECSQQLATLKDMGLNKKDLTPKS
jgi:ArsR family metal-binding transcriptional regulator